MNFTPTYTVKDTVHNTRDFINTHSEDFKALLFKILPFLLLATLLQASLPYITGSDFEAQIEAIASESEKALKNIEQTRGEELSKEDSIAHTQQTFNKLVQFIISSPYAWLTMIIQLFIAYLYAVMAINWHRLVLLGKNNFEEMEIFEPQKHELEFIGILMLVSVIIPIVIWYFGISQTIAGNTTALLSMSALLIIFPYLLFKICFYFPAKAVNSHITFKQSFRMTFGYFWKLTFSYIRSILKVVLISLALMIIYGMIIGVAFALIFGVGEDGHMPHNALMQNIINLPVTLYFQPLFTIFGVTVLSNYYQHALQNKTIPS